MLEIERKILEIDKHIVQSRIKKLQPQAHKLFEGFIRVRYFDFPDHRIRKKKDLLRLREIIPRRGKAYTELVYKTYKGAKKNSKYFNECEITILGADTFKTATELLRKFGVKQVVYYEKKRMLYRWGKVFFEIDVHPKIPPFLEIEAPSPKAIDKAIKLLHLEQYEQTSETISELIRRKYPKIKLNGLKFQR